MGKRYARTMDSKRRKLLNEFVGQYGEDWYAIAQNFASKSAYYLEKRWKNRQYPNMRHSNWTPEGDNKITNMFTEIGGKWIKIAKEFSGRSPNSIKNRYYSTLSKPSKLNSSSQNVSNDHFSSKMMKLVSHFLIKEHDNLLKIEPDLLKYDQPNFYRKQVILDQLKAMQSERSRRLNELQVEKYKLNSAIKSQDIRNSLPILRDSPPSSPRRPQREQANSNIHQTQPIQLEQEKEQISCEICHQNFPSNSSKSVHMKIHKKANIVSAGKQEIIESEKAVNKEKNTGPTVDNTVDITSVEESHESSEEEPNINKEFTVNQSQYTCILCYTSFPNLHECESHLSDDHPDDYQNFGFSILAYLSAELAPTK